MKKVTFQLDTLTCPSCVGKIEGMMKRTKGITEGEVLFNTSRARITFDESVISSEDIKSNIERLGFDVLGER